MSHKDLALDDLLARDVSVAWYEGVALVQAVCRAVGADGRSSAFPSAPAIRLGADGAVSLSGAWVEGPPVAAAARLLSEMGCSDLPVQLRLAVTQAAAPGSPYGSLEELSRALAYFERADPDQILRGLYERAARAERRGGFVPHAAEPAPAASTPAAANADARKKPRSQMPLMAGLATAAGLSLVAVVSGGLPGMGQSVTLGFSMFENTVRAKLGAGEADVAATPATETPVEAGGAVQTPAPQATRGTGAGPAVAPRRMPRAIVAASPLVALSGFPRLTPPDLLPLRAGAVPQFYSSVEVIAGQAALKQEAAGTIYSARDAGVVPPRAIYPVLPAAPPPGTSLEDKTVVDLVISPAGLVDGVRLRTTPRNIHEFMLLSAAKAWRFDPAVHEDGYPVWFRHNVVLTGIP